MRRRIILENGVKTESVTINVATSNGASASGITITINEIETTTNADGVAYGEVPYNTEYSIVFGEKTNYSTPATITRTASAETYTTAVTYTLLNETCTVTSNLSTTITINNNSKSNTKSYSVDVPYGTVYTVSVANKSNYNKPSNKTFTASTSSRSVTMNYTAKTETVKVTSNIETNIYVNGNYIGYGTSAQTTITYGTTYTVSGSSIDWYNTPSVQTFTANSSTRNVSLNYSKQSVFVKVIFNYSSSYTTASANANMWLTDENGSGSNAITIVSSTLMGSSVGVTKVTRSVDIGDYLRDGYTMFSVVYVHLNSSNYRAVESVSLSPSGNITYTGALGGYYNGAECYSGNYIPSNGVTITVNGRT